MTPEDNIIYNRLVPHDHRIRESELYRNVPLLSTFWESKQSHNTIIYGTNKYNTYNGCSNLKTVKNEGKFFFNFNRQIEPVRPEQDNNSNAAIIEFAKICLDEMVKYEFLFMEFASIRTSYKNNPCYPGFGSHFINSFYFSFFDCVNIPPVLIRLNAHPGLTHFAKPRHNHSLLIPGRISTPGCDRGGAFVLTTKDTKNENYKLQITNYKQITNPKLQITNPSLETEYKDYNGERSQLAIVSWQPENRLAFNFLTNIPILLSTGPGEAPSTGPAQRVFLFLTAKAREETRREENYKRFKCANKLN